MLSTNLDDLLSPELVHTIYGTNLSHDHIFVAPRRELDAELYF